MKIEITEEDLKNPITRDFIKGLIEKYEELSLKDTVESLKNVNHFLEHGF